MKNMHENIGIVILAAGKGTRMCSARPKVLHTLLEESMLDLVISALQPISPKIWTVVGHKAELVRQIVGERCDYIIQTEQLGTGHALITAWEALKNTGLEYLLVVNGDVPLLDTEHSIAFVNECLRQQIDLGFMSMTLEDPAAFGRVLRDNTAQVSCILEAKDYDQKLHGPEPKEINTGIYFLKMQSIEPLLQKLNSNNKSNEYYITQLIHLAVHDKLHVLALDQGYRPELLGVNSPLELVEAENLLRINIVGKWLKQGVLIRNLESVRIGPQVTLEPGADICGPSEIYGTSHIEAGACIESHNWIKNAYITTGTKVRSFCHIEDTKIGANCSVGPYARLRPGAVLEEEAHIGNFVEMKKAVLGKGAKANHLTYLGDTIVGAKANIGAGTITCNYDGVHKYQTIIGERAFIGSNSSLVAPVRIGNNALIGAGSVITKDVEDNQLALTRAPQKSIPRKIKS